MPKKTGKTDKPAWLPDFVGLSLTPQQKLDLVDWDEDGTRSFDAVAEAVRAGYKFTWNFDEYNDAYTASITTPKSDDGTRAQCLTSRGPDPIGAVRSLGYKVLMILDGALEALINYKVSRDKWD